MSQTLSEYLSKGQQVLKTVYLTESFSNILNCVKHLVNTEFLTLYSLLRFKQAPKNSGPQQINEICYRLTCNL